MNPNHYHLLEAKIIEWAERRPDVRAVLVVGSRARNIHPADELADLDLILFTHVPQIYSRQPEELDHIAPCWLVVANHTEGAHREWLVLFADGYKVDFYFAPIARHTSLTTVLPQMSFQSVLARGLRVLIDKTSSGSGRTGSEQIPAPQPGSPSGSAERSWPPTAEQFRAEADSTLLSASRAVKFIWRGDLWRAKFQIDADLKRHLLTLIEWQAQAAAGRRIDTWYDGRFLADWATTHVLEALPATFGNYERHDLLRALGATLELFDWLARDTAGRLALDYPQTNQAAVAAWLSAQIELAQTEME